MFIAHVPAGYLLTRALTRVFHWTFLLEIAIAGVAAMRLAVSRAALFHNRHHVTFLRGSDAPSRSGDRGIQMP